MSKKVLVILGHPTKSSFCGDLFRIYLKGAKKSKKELKVKSIALSDLKFDPILHEGYNKRQSLEKDLLKAQELIKWADHLVIIYPTWWGGMPALLKGFIDRIILPGFGFKFKNRVLWNRMFKGKSARLIVPSGGPLLSYFFLGGNPAVKSMKYLVLKFCGVSPVRVTTIGFMRRTPNERKKRIMRKIERLGEKGC